jgi:hypothetical protein
MVSDLVLVTTTKKQEEIPEMGEVHNKDNKNIHKLENITQVGCWRLHSFSLRRIP